MSGVTLRRARRRPRAGLGLTLASALILVTGWTVLWCVGRWQAGEALDRWIADEALRGRTWTCPDRAITGYPFRVALVCPALTFAGAVDGSPAAGRLAGFKAEAYLYEPNAVGVVLDGPLALTTRDGRADFTLDWSDFRIVLRGLVGGLKRVEIVSDGATLTRPGGEGGRADHFELHTGPATGLPPGTSADTVEIGVSGLSLPVLDTVLNDTGRIDASLLGVVTHAYGDLPDLGTATVERWRRAGGRFDVSKFMLVKGDLRAAAAGSLGLDEDHRLAGRLDASFAGYTAIAQRFGLSLRTVAIGGLLANILGGRSAPAPDASAGAGSVTLPVVVANGTLAIGPFKTPLRLQPLY